MRYLGISILVGMICLTGCREASSGGEGSLNVGQGQAIPDGTWADAAGALVSEGTPCTVIKIAAHTLLTAESCLGKTAPNSSITIVYAKEFAEGDKAAEKITTFVTEVHRFGTYEKVTIGEDGVALPQPRYQGADIAVIRTGDTLAAMRGSFELDFTRQRAGTLLTTVGYGCPITVGAFEFQRDVFRMQKGAMAVLAVGPNPAFSDDYFQGRSRVSEVCAADAGGPILRFDGNRPFVVGVNAGDATIDATGANARVGVHTRIDSETAKNADDLSVADWLKTLLK